MLINATKNINYCLHYILLTLKSLTLTHSYTNKYYTYIKSNTLITYNLISFNINCIPYNSYEHITHRSNGNLYTITNYTYFIILLIIICYLHAKHIHNKTNYTLVYPHNYNDFLKANSALVYFSYG